MNNGKRTLTAVLFDALLVIVILAIVAISAMMLGEWL